MNKGHTYHTHQRKMTSERDSVKKSAPPILPTPPFLWGKSEPPPFLINFENTTPHPLLHIEKGSNTMTVVHF